jgi:myo-inositol-1(or 4)-monophosphatase
MNKPSLLYVEELARKAGRILHDNYETELVINFKSEIDLVTHVDHESENFIINEINQTFVEHKFLAEESGESAGTSDHLWIIDPLDGTVNYAHGVPFFCVSIAYAYKGEVKLAAVYDPMRNEMFSAERGQGARLNQRPLKVKQADKLKQSLLVTGFPYDAWHTAEHNFDNYERFGKLTQGVRRMGSAALDLCYIASGRLDGYWELSVKAWDVAAAGLIAEEAGAKVTNIKGEGNYIDTPVSIIAANEVLHAQILAELNRS